MDAKCKKHPSHKQTKGICPYCLKERLEQLTASSASSTNFSSSMASSAAFSSDNDSSNASSNESPRHKHRSKKTLLHLLNKGVKEESLRRSSSLAFPIVEGKEEGKEKKKKKIKKRSKRSGSMFWTKFILAGEERKKEKELEGLYHSKTVKEKPSSKWAFFA